MQPHLTPKKSTQEIPYGCCHCGCGGKTNLARKTNARMGWTKNKPVRFIRGHHNKPRIERPVEERFWEKVASAGPDDCWPWIASTGTGGYGKISVDGEHTKATRVGWRLVFGPIPEGMFVLHKCDNPPCCNPTHWFLGTQQDNMDDMKEKGRGRYGEKAYQAKLNENSVIQIRKLWIEGENLSDLGRRFGVAPATIRDVVYNKTWRHAK